MSFSDPSTAPVSHPTHSHFGAELFVRDLQQRMQVTPETRILIAGCGSGHEAFYIRESTGAEVHAIDIEDFLEVGPEARAEINFNVGSVCELPFQDNWFDAVFFYHVIEHVDQPEKSLEEIHRVTRDDGWVFVGTPNRSRIVSSVGAHTQSEWEPSFWNKLNDNVRDWKDRLTGRFHNHLGAHAGFKTGELDRLANRFFQRVDWVTQQYLRGKYQHHRLSWLVRLATIKPIQFIAAPSIYAWCQKQARQRS